MENNNTETKRKREQKTLTQSPDLNPDKRRRSAEEIIRQILSKAPRNPTKTARKVLEDFNLDKVSDDNKFKDLTEIQPRKPLEIEPPTRIIVRQPKKEAIENARRLLEKLSEKPKPKPKHEPEPEHTQTQVQAPKPELKLIPESIPEANSKPESIPEMKTRMETRDEIRAKIQETISSRASENFRDSDRNERFANRRDRNQNSNSRTRILPNRDEILKQYKLSRERERSKESELLKEREQRREHARLNQMVYDAQAENKSNAPIELIDLRQKSEPAKPAQTQAQSETLRKPKPDSNQNFQQQHKQKYQQKYQHNKTQQRIPGAFRMSDLYDHGNVKQKLKNIPDEKSYARDSEYAAQTQNRASKNSYTFAALNSKDVFELREIATKFNLRFSPTKHKEDIIFAILKAQTDGTGFKFGGGTLEIMQEGFGFLRPQGMLPTENDVYLSASQIRKFGLRNGDIVWGLVRAPRDQEHYDALLRVDVVNYTTAASLTNRPLFTELTPMFPDRRLTLESKPEELSTRLIDMFTPIGFGQRALIVSPPKAGKTTLLKDIASAISRNFPEIVLIALLIDERPEEVTDISMSIEGEIISSTFDRPADEHVRVASLALEKAKRLVEAHRDVVVLLDSITRLARASNLLAPSSGRTLSGGVDASGLHFPKQFFGAARNFVEGGSLTIIGTALVDTGSRMDDIIYEEFKGTGNMELHLSRRLADQRIFPAIDITRSGTRREELLIPPDDLTRLWALRKRITGIDETSALSVIINKLKQTKDNQEFLASIKLD